MAMLQEATPDGGLYLAGEPASGEICRALNRWLLDELYPRARQRAGVLDWNLTVDRAAWMPRLCTILRGTRPMRNRRITHMLEAEDVPAGQPPETLPRGMALRPVDADLLAATDLEHYEHIRRWVDGWWGGNAEFLARGVGACLVEDDRILVSWCLADWASGSRIELGIHTAEAYRRRGYGTMTARDAVQQALEHGYTTIGWHLWAGNAASAATARRAGLRQTHDEVIYHAWYHPIDNALVNAGYRLGRSNPGAAAAWYERAFALIAQGGPDTETMAIHDDDDWAPIRLAAARAWAAVGDAARARVHIDEALALGADADRLTADDLLSPLL
jgi:RimJ/RimL family protein N-acetyltransferase